MAARRIIKSLLLILVSFAFTGGSMAQDATDRGVRRTTGIHTHYAEQLRMYLPAAVEGLGLNLYYDYDEALAASKRLGKPVFVNFTGINCVNCRKMESVVWKNPEVAKRLVNDFIVTFLYCDMNKIELPADQQYFSRTLNKKVTTLGWKYCDLQESKFGSNSQPCYYFVDDRGKKLVPEVYAYDPDPKKFVAWLDKVKTNYKKGH